MPRYRKETAELKAKAFTRLYVKKDLCQARVAEAEGVTRQAINARIKHLPVRDALRDWIDSPRLKRRLVDVAQKALRATRMTKRGNKPDHDARHKYWHDLVTAGGILKNDGGGGVKIVNIIHNYRKEKNAPNT